MRLLPSTDGCASWQPRGDPTITVSFAPMGQRFLLPSRCTHDSSWGISGSFKWHCWGLGSPSITRKMDQNSTWRDFRDSPLAKAPHFHCRGHGFEAWSEELRSLMPKNKWKKPKWHLESPLLTLLNWLGTSTFIQLIEQVSYSAFICNAFNV